MKYILCAVVAAVAIAAVVIVVDNSSSSLVQPAASADPAQEKTEQEQDYTLVQQQQAPHVVKLTAGAPVLHAVTDAVVSFMTGQINHNFIVGPYDHGSCAAAGGSGARPTFRCTLVANQLSYPFDVVADPAASKITYCEVVTPPIPSLRVPVSSRCL